MTTILVCFYLLVGMMVFVPQARQCWRPGDRLATVIALLFCVGFWLPLAVVDFIRNERGVR